MSARSSSQGLQKTLESKMVSVHKDLLGAPEGKINMIFVDDVNLPARDEYNSQPPVEFLRQLVSNLFTPFDSNIRIFLSCKGRWEISGTCCAW